MEYREMLNQTCEIGDKLQGSINDILLQEQYCAKMEILTIYLRQKREEAQLKLKYFREINDKFFNQSMKILELAIDNANVELAKSALDGVRVMRETYPEFYRSFNDNLFL